MEEFDDLLKEPDESGYLDLSHRAWATLDDVLWTWGQQLIVLNVSFNNIKTILDCSYNDHRKTGLFYDSLSTQEGMKWFQIEDYGPWKLEDTVDMVYNSLVAYPTHFFHSPYIKEDWFTDTDRITISSFLNTSPENLDFQQKDLDDIAYAWEFFHLDKIHNYHPKKTVTT